MKIPAQLLAKFRRSMGMLRRKNALRALEKEQANRFAAMNADRLHEVKRREDRIRISSEHGPWRNTGIGD